jgi:hypothetical protein
VGDHDAAGEFPNRGVALPPKIASSARSRSRPIGTFTKSGQRRTLGPRQMTVPLFCAMVPGRDDRLDLRDIKFRPHPDDPTGACQMAVLRGDLARGSSAIAYKSERTTCVVPVHWHPSAEWLVVVYGVGVIESKGQKRLRLTKGGFFFQPAHQIGGGTFQPNTLIFISFDGSADTHWVDEEGKEITVKILAEIESGKSAQEVAKMMGVSTARFIAARRKRPCQSHQLRVPGSLYPPHLSPASE